MSAVYEYSVEYRVQCMVYGTLVTPGLLRERLYGGMPYEQPPRTYEYGV
jgi:hypothetical protein